MSEHVCFIGFDAEQADELRRGCPHDSVAFEMLPKIRVHGDSLEVLAPHVYRFDRVTRVVFHGIFEYDVDFLAALALWAGPCFPPPLPMLDCRLRLPGLVRALRYTRFPIPGRGYVSPRTPFEADVPSVAKWGNWHCGENKEQFRGAWEHDEASLIEPFLAGDAIRVILVGDQVWQIRMTGRDWKKSVHGEGAALMPVDAELVADTQALRDGLGLTLIANDYIVAADGAKHLLEVNHIPSVTCFPELWTAYRDVVLQWLAAPLACRRPRPTMST